jgi:hypothetical protein
VYGTGSVPYKNSHIILPALCRVCGTAAVPDANVHSCITVTSSRRESTDDDGDPRAAAAQQRGDRDQGNNKKKTQLQREAAARGKRNCNDGSSFDDDGLDW